MAGAKGEDMLGKTANIKDDKGKKKSRQTPLMEERPSTYSVAPPPGLVPSLEFHRSHTIENITILGSDLHCEPRTLHSSGFFTHRKISAPTGLSPPLPFLHTNPLPPDCTNRQKSLLNPFIHSMSYCMLFRSICDALEKKHNNPNISRVLLAYGSRAESAKEESSLNSKIKEKTAGLEKRLLLNEQQEKELRYKHFNAIAIKMECLDSLNIFIEKIENNLGLRDDPIDSTENIKKTPFFHYICMIAFIVFSFIEESDEPELYEKLKTDITLTIQEHFTLCPEHIKHNIYDLSETGNSILSSVISYKKEIAFLKKRVYSTPSDKYINFLKKHHPLKYTHNILKPDILKYKHYSAMIDVLEKILSLSKNPLARIRFNINIEVIDEITRHDKLIFIKRDFQKKSQKNTEQRLSHLINRFRILLLKKP
ncbi:MAG: hypothetical protein K0R12_574 [Gammaproteobacteria bacterium]|nr:hypothetical protein [Gammaproteobacteria bacterium]